MHRNVDNRSNRSLTTANHRRRALDRGRECRTVLADNGQFIGVPSGTRRAQGHLLVNQPLAFGCDNIGRTHPADHFLDRIAQQACQERIDELETLILNDEDTHLGRLHRITEHCFLIVHRHGAICQFLATIDIRFPVELTIVSADHRTPPSNPLGSAAANA
ncbi:hypothetical protein SDC9_189998 [bioreactor metagenome]|uniref:Uncharacterized protein n=1 Tax=bioreactor metagenome TaxID=1076179 RepID=A0A645HTS0_9ZZZZ